MPSPSSLALLQAAGAAIYAAQQSVEQDFQHISTKLQETIMATPYGANTEQTITDLKSVAQIANEMKAVEENMRKIFRQAEGLSVVVQAAPARAPRQLAHVVQEVATDVSPKKAKKLSPNAERLHGYLKNVLSSSEARKLTHAEMIQGSGLAAGSINASLKALVDANLVKVVDRGIYRLA